MAERSLRALVDNVERRHPGLVRLEGDVGGAVITGVTQDSRTVRSGELFCAIVGVSVDGHDHLDAATEAGAGALLVLTGRELSTTPPIPVLRSPDNRRAAGVLAAEFHGNPSDHLDLVGVTGTNGKTTIVTLVEHLAHACGRKSESMGTLTGPLTTAAATTFQRSLRERLDRGIDLVAAEVSSHALDQERVAGSRFAVSVFTNLTQDHLDYHADMDEYFDAKARLFHPDLSEHAVIDVSGEWGARLADLSAIPTNRVDTAVIADAARFSDGRWEFEWRGRDVCLPLGGRFNVVNAVLAAEAAATLGMEPGEIADALVTAPQVPGRFERIDCGQPFEVVVDYSHTPASLEAAIATAAELVPGGRVITVFGAAGDRDPSKRPLMGAAASSSDVLYVTSDNPRTEDPDAIINEVISGISHLDTRREPDRRLAIRTAIAGASSGDLVLIAGKGHEDYQIIGTTRHDFDDRVEARAALADIGWTDSA
ncbi:MAG: UDP-N-acetylmuramoyl-L-alanyl-D-glutamate--2,6-diaminopimelate ligase [Acidimicrobiales bacterium]